MERHEILEATGELKLYGMRASFDEVAGKGIARRDELYPLIASLNFSRGRPPAGAFDQLSHCGREVPRPQGYRQVRLRRYPGR